MTRRTARGLSAEECARVAGAALAVAIATALVAGCGSTTTSTATVTVTARPSSKVTANRSFTLSGTRTGARASVATIARLPKGRHVVARARFAGLSGLALPDKLQSLANNVASFWAAEFQAAGAQLTPANVSVIASTPDTCGSRALATTDPPIYCVATSTVELPLGYIQSNVAPIGDAALALLVSDVYGYHIENVIGELTPSAGLTPVQLAQTDSCFSGTYFYYLQAQKALGPGDEAAVNQFLASVAASSGGGTTPGAVTQDELTTAFNQGIESRGNASVCIARGGATTTTTTTS